LKSTKFEWNSLPIPAKSSDKKNKTTYICPSCNAKIWGKPEMNIICGECEEQFEKA
jgi:hypothetical protein